MLAARDLFDSIPGALALLLFGLISALANYLRNRQAQRQQVPGEHADGDEPHSTGAEPPVARPTTVTARREERTSRGAVRPTPEALPPVAAPPILVELERRPEPTRSRRRADQAAALRLQKRLEQSRRAAQAQAAQAAMQRALATPAPATAAPAPKVSSRRPFIGPLDRAQLRRAIVLNEILGPPVALRDQSW